MSPMQLQPHVSLCSYQALCVRESILCGNYMPCKDNSMLGSEWLGKCKLHSGSPVDSLSFLYLPLLLHHDIGTKVVIRPFISNNRQVKRRWCIRNDRLKLGCLCMQLMHRSASQMMDNPTVRAVSGLLRNFSSNIPETLLAGLPGDLLTQQSRPPSVPQTARAWRPGDTSFFQASKLDPEL